MQQHPLLYTPNLNHIYLQEFHGAIQNTTKQLSLSYPNTGALRKKLLQNILGVWFDIVKHQKMGNSLSFCITNALSYKSYGLALLYFLLLRSGNYSTSWQDDLLSCYPKLKETYYLLNIHSVPSFFAFRKNWKMNSRLNYCRALDISQFNQDSQRFVSNRRLILAAQKLVIQALNIDPWVFEYLYFYVLLSLQLGQLSNKMSDAIVQSFHFILFFCRKCNSILHWKFFFHFVTNFQAFSGKKGHLILYNICLRWLEIYPDAQEPFQKILELIFLHDFIDQIEDISVLTDIFYSRLLLCEKTSNWRFNPADFYFFLQFIYLCGNEYESCTSKSQYFDVVIQNGGIFKMISTSQRSSKKNLKVRKYPRLIDAFQNYSVSHWEMLKSLDNFPHPVSKLLYIVLFGL